MTMDRCIEGAKTSQIKRKANICDTIARAGLSVCVILGKLLSLQDRHYLFGPVVLSSGWPCPARLKPLVLPARLQQIREGNPEHASDVEALAYLSTASMGGPLDSDHADIMLWLTRRIFPESVAFLQEHGEETMGQYETGLLQDLKGKIRRAVVKHAKDGR